MVLRILRNEKYSGDLLQRKYRTTDYLTHRKVRNDGTEEQFYLRDHHEPIIDRKQFDEVQKELARRAGMVEDKRKFSARYWYSGKICCGSCGKSFVMKRTRRPNEAEYRRFVCRGHLDGTRNCQMRAVHAEVIFTCAQYVLSQLSLNNSVIVDQLLQELQQLHRQQANGDEIPKFRQALQRQLDRKDHALIAFLDGDLSRSDMQRLVARCEEEIKRLQGQLEVLEKTQNDLEREADHYSEIRALLEQELAGGDCVLEEVIERITVYPDHFLVEVAELPVRFRVRAKGSGTGCGYHIDILECTLLPIEA